MTLGKEMDTSITISAVSVIIACCSFWVAYKAFLHSTESRKADKLLGLRIQVVELRSKFVELKYNSQSLSKKQPTIHDPFINEKLDKCMIIAKKFIRHCIKIFLT